jgi:hypothetical protein
LAARLIEQVYADDPHNPGALHYMIHAYDDPVHAAQGLKAARAYAQAAPAVPAPPRRRESKRWCRSRDGGFGGATNFNHRSFETLTWAATSGRAALRGAVSYVADHVGENRQVCA